MRWFITSMIAVHVLSLLQGIDLTEAEAVGIAALIGPAQVAGRLLEYVIGPRVDLLVKARVGALLLPMGAALLLLGGPYAATGFALLYGMSNGILTINRGTLPLALFGPAGTDPRLVEAVGEWLGQLYQSGSRATLETAARKLDF